MCANSEWRYRYKDHISHGLMMAAARCYCDWDPLSATQCSNGRGDVIYPLLQVPWAIRYGHLPRHTLPFHSFVPAHRPPEPLLNPSHDSV
jgi:hypothetical protein